MGGPAIKLMLDSGAFSAWTIGAEIDIDDYCAYIYRNSDWISCYVNLDVIPGVPKRTPTTDEIEQAAARSWANLEHMQGMGLNPMPVFHQGERFYWLRRMVEAGVDYIGLGGLVGTRTYDQIKWMDRVFNYLCDASGRSRVKTHAFGVATATIIRRYPLTTVDATSWLVAGSKFGLIRCPRMGKDGRWDLTRNLISLRISKEAPNVSGHFNRLSPADQASVIKFIEEAGMTLEDVIERYRARAVVNAYSLKLLSDANQDVRYRRRQIGLFEDE